MFRRPPPPSEAPPSRGWHVASNTPSVRFLCILVDYYKIRYRAFAFVVELLVVIWMVDDACLLCP